MRLFELIGNTPLIELEHIPTNPKVKILCKLEGQNPGGSVKDRAAYNMLRAALDRGEIKKGDKLVEATSGNTGIALAMVAKVLGLDMTLIMPDNSTKERVLSMEAYGARVILTPAAKTIEYSRILAEQMRDEEGRPVETIASLSGLSQTRPGLAAALAIFMFSLAGIPPLFGFWAKFLVFDAAVGAGLTALAAIGIAASVIGAFYYLKIVKTMYFDEPAGAFAPPQSRLESGLIGVSALFVAAGYPLIPALGSATAAAAGSLF